MLSSTSETGTKSGIITSENGERHIPSSLRPDGTKRKEIRIRPGYRPAEDVEVYKNRTAEAWKSRGSGGVPGLDKGDDANGESKSASNKNAKRREARRKAKASEDGNPVGGASEDQVNEATGAKSSTDPVSKHDWRAPASSVQVDLDSETAEKEKLVRNLKKKLRQARELREKKDNGDGLLPEQFEKVIKMNEVIRQLDSLGFNADGEPKRD